MLYPVIDFIEKGKDFAILSAQSKMWLYIGKIYDALYIPKGLLSLMSTVFFLLMIRQYLNYKKMTYSKLLTENILADMRATGFEGFISADIGFYDSHNVGEMINVMSIDATRAGSGIFSFFNLLAASTIFVTYFLILLLLSPGMTLFAISIMSFVGIILRSRIQKSGELGKKVSKFNKNISSAIVERLGGIRLIKLSSTERKESDFIKGLSERIRLNSYEIAVIRARMEFMVDPMVIFAGLTILYFSVEIFHMSLSKTGIFLFILLRITPYSKDIFNARQSLAGFSGSLERVRNLFKEAREATTIQGGEKKEVHLRKEITFDNVSFRYRPGGPLALENVSLVFPAGRMTALVGRSGAGKSTLIDLIPRLRIPEEGSISMDGVHLEAFDLSTLRRSIAFVSQEGFLFDDTIANNIRYCRPEAGEDELIQASRMAYADPFIANLVDGYQTVVGERGVMLSGGQRQRLILARALLQKAEIIIMDEPTSALDSESERYIQKAIEEIRKNCTMTIIVIAHRLSTIKSADQIMVLDKGRVIETGCHGDLIYDDRWYAEMVKIQDLS